MATKPDLTQYTDWRTAVTDLVAYFTEQGLCYTSGGIVREIRLVHPNLRFSATAVGEFVRDIFYSNALPEYVDDFGQSMPPVQVPRVTVGTGRTGAGVQVMVYGPDVGSCSAFDFEVDIPEPGAIPPAPIPSHQVPGFVPSQSGMSAPQPTPVTPTTSPVVIHGVPSALADHRATVGADRRLSVTRGAMEAYIHAVGTPLRASDPLYVSFLPGSIQITLVQPTTHPSAPYDLTRTKGQIVLGSPIQPFNPGDVYSVKVDATALTVDLSKALNTTR